MELQAFLRQHGLTALCEQYTIKVNRYNEFPNLVCLKYSQRESPMHEPIVQQCRGIILDESNDWAIVSHPYDKFFNYGEPNAVAIDWHTARVYDKLDGSLMVLYFYAGQWRVQSSGSADASGEVGGFNFSFQQLFWQVWQELDYALPTEAEQNQCFIFELMTPYNRVVVKHSHNQLVLHGVRDRITGQESRPEAWAARYGWASVNTVELGTWEAIVAAAKTLDPLAAEGYIVCDGAFRRVKVKSPEYVALTHLRDSISPRTLLQVVVQNEGDEFLAYYPEWQDLYDRIRRAYEGLVQTVETAYQTYQHIPEQKDFAVAIRGLPYAGLLFTLRAGKATSVRQAVQDLSQHKLEQFLLAS